MNFAYVYRLGSGRNSVSIRCMRRCRFRRKYHMLYFAFFSFVSRIPEVKVQNACIAWVSLESNKLANYAKIRSNEMMKHAMIINTPCLSGTMANWSFAEGTSRNWHKHTIFSPNNNSPFGLRVDVEGGDAYPCSFRLMLFLLFLPKRPFVSVPFTENRLSVSMPVARCLYWLFSRPEPIVWKNLTNLASQ